MAAGNKKARHLLQEVTSRCVQTSKPNGADFNMSAHAVQPHGKPVIIAFPGRHRGKSAPRAFPGRLKAPRGNAVAFAAARH